MKGTPRQASTRMLSPNEASAVFARAATPGWYRVEGGKLALPLLVRLGRTPEGEIACTALTLGMDADPPVRVAAAATRVPLQEIVASIARGLRFDHQMTKGGGVGFWGRPEEMGLLVDNAPRVAVPRARPGARGYTDEDLRDFAREYREALKTHPRAPTKTLATRRSLSDQAIRYQRRLAEERGYLRPRRQRAMRKGGRRA